MAKSAKYDLIAVGGTTTDILFYSKDGELISTGNAVKQKLLAFEYGAKIIADRVITTCGGGAANAAVAGARLGLKTSIVCRIGRDANGAAVMANFKQNKVGTSHIKIDSAEATAFTTVLTIDNPSKEHIAFVYRGANAKLSAKDLPAKIDAKWLYATSLPKNNWEAIMDRLVRSGIKITWNPGNEQLAEVPKMSKYLPHIEVLLLNRDEALEFKKLKDIKGLLAHIQGLGPKLVVITDGASGAYAYDGKNFHFMKAKSRKLVNTLGVGDAFGASLTSALICDKTIKEALAWAVNNSASVVSQIGAQKGLLTRKEII